ncbi:MAG: M4 family metallopeptidase [Chitinophagaceae bacterium]
MKKLFLAGTTGLVLFCGHVKAQQLKSQRAGQAGMFPADMQFDGKSAPIFQRGVVPVPDAKGILVDLPGMNVSHAETDAFGQEHIRYQQSFQGIPIEHAVLVQHVENNKVVYQNGKIIRDFSSQMIVTPTLSAQVALSRALASVNARLYKWQVPAEEAFIKSEQGSKNASFFPKGTLVFYSGEEEVIPSAMHLAYKFDIYAQDPVSRQIIFVDARTGEILGKRELIHEANATGTAVTALSGTQTITTDKVSATSYRLRETGRGNGIQTFNLNAGSNYGAATDFGDSDNTWNNDNAAKDQYATDAHWGAEKTYDYYFTKFNRNSIDNAGYIIQSYVHYSTNYFNAFWDGARMTYGDGNATHNSKPLTALDICGHEISHGVTSYTSNLTYSGESGALNEGFSDIFGTAIEFYARPGNANWLMGSDVYTLRSMSNPNDYKHPDTYLGTYWVASDIDYGGVHTNCGVLNYWFYLLSMGGSGTNDNGTAFNVTGLGIDKAAAIAYRTNTYYLVSTSKYADARTYAIKAAQDLYGANSNEAIQTVNAWNAVGVAGSDIPPIAACPDNYEANETKTTAKVIAVNTDISASIGSSIDQDWFKFTTTASSPKIQLTLSGLPANYDVKLYNNAGTQIGISQNTGTNTETINYSTRTAATYFVQVYGNSGAFNSATCYTLRVATSSASLFGGFFGITDNPANALLAVQPVPAVDFTTISFGSSIAGKAQIIVTNLAGAVVFRNTMVVTAGTNQLQLNVSGFTSGMYVLKMVNGNDTQVQKLIVEH